MYILVLSLHSWLRWVVLGLVLVGLVRGLAGSRARREWGPADERAQKLFVVAVDVQLLLGLLLYAVLSPETHLAFADFAHAMKDRVLRFWAVEHASAMFLAAVVAHVGRVLGKKHGASSTRHRTALVTALVFLLLVALAFPWPGLAQGRPLFRFGA